MKTFKTTMRFMKKINFKNMFKIVDQVSDKSGKSFLITLIDVIYCGLVYGAGYYDYQEFEFYLLNKKERKTYLTRVKNNQIIKKYNDLELFHKFDNKGLFNYIFKDYIKRDYIVIDQHMFEEFKDFTIKHNEIIVKPEAGDCGFGIEKFYIDSKTDLKQLFDKLITNDQLLIEECIVQHKEISNLYSKSVNTLRLFTFYDGEKSHVLNSVFKLGNGGVTDNFSSGSMYTFVNDEGEVMVPAIDQNDYTYKIHPITKKQIVGFIVPFYKESCEMVNNAASIVPEVKYIGWDIAITDDGPLIIEGNSFPGVFQMKPSLSIKKEGLIPKYQKVMDIK